MPSASHDGLTEGLDTPGAILPRTAAARPDATALITPTRTLTYGELDDLCGQRRGRSRRAWGAAGRPGLALRAELLGVDRHRTTASLKAGAVVNPINAMLTPAEVAFVLHRLRRRGRSSPRRRQGSMRSAGWRRRSTSSSAWSSSTPRPTATAAFGDLLALAAGRRAAPAIRPTTCRRSATRRDDRPPEGRDAVPPGRRPQLRAHRHDALPDLRRRRGHGAAGAARLRQRRHQRHVPRRRHGGAAGPLRPWPGPRGRSPSTGPRMFEGVPAMYAMVLADPDLGDVDLSSLRCCTVGGQTMPVATMEAWEQPSGAPLLELWGMTELAGLGTTHAVHCPNRPAPSASRCRASRCGSATSRIRRRRCAAASRASCWCAGRSSMLGYFGNAAATAGGDRARRLAAHRRRRGHGADGHFSIVDRRKDMIITGGYNVYPAEIERVLAAHPAVAISAVGPVADPSGGAGPGLRRAEAGRTATEDELIAHCRVAARRLQAAAVGAVRRRPAANLDRQGHAPGARTLDRPSARSPCRPRPRRPAQAPAAAEGGARLLGPGHGGRP